MFAGGFAGDGEACNNLCGITVAIKPDDNMSYYTGQNQKFKWNKTGVAYASNVVRYRLLLQQVQFSPQR
jgi:hypothetical protein